MAILRLFDTSQYIASGPKGMMLAKGVIEDEGVYRANEMPIGGVFVLLKTIKDFNDDNTDLVYCFERTPDRKREIHRDNFPLMNGYKGNRPLLPNYDAIKIQRQLSEDIIKAVGFDCIALDGLEADDCIASIVTYYKKYYDKVIIHTRDSDLFYLVCENVEIEPVCNTGKRISMLNWEDTVKKDTIMPYNTMTISKMIHGETGDNIPKVSKRVADIIVDQLPQSEYPKCGNNTLLREWLLKVTNNDKQTMAIFDLIAPIIVPFADVELNETDFDEQLFNQFYHELQCGGIADGLELIDNYLNIYNGR